MKQNIQPAARRSELVVQNLGHEILIYDLSVNKAFCLNQTSAMVWNLCDGRNSIEQISRILSQNLPEPMTEDLIWLALDQFKRDGLLEDEQVEIDFNGLTRRQVIRKVGLASLIALPLVSSVIAPSAANAQSVACVPLGGACINAGGTQSNCCNSDQRCYVRSFGATCNPCYGLGITLGFCLNLGCCAGISSASCCNPGPLVEVPAEDVAIRFECQCP